MCKKIVTIKNRTFTLITDNLTPKEVEVLIASRISDFSDAYDEGTWSFDVQEKCKLPVKSYGGVVASLVKKGYVTLYDYERFGRFRDMVFVLTDKGRNLFIE